MPSSPPKSEEASVALTGAALPQSGGSDRRSREEYPELMVYEAMGRAIVSSVNEFLQTFQSGPDSTLSLKSMAREDFFPKFFRLANKLTDDCCQELVKIIRASSVLASVREAPVPGLAKRIRDTAFKSLDEILGSYLGTAKRIETIYKNVRTVQSALEKAAVATQPPSPDEPVPAAPAASGAGASWATEDELARQHQSLLQAQTQAFSKIVQYLNGIQRLPAALLAYACDKCFAGEVNYHFEHEQAAESQEGIKNRLANAIETMTRVAGEAKQDVEEERAQIMANLELQKAHQVLEKIWQGKMEAKLKSDQRFKRIVIWCFGGLLLIVVVVIAFFAILFVRQ